HEIWWGHVYRRWHCLSPRHNRYVAIALDLHPTPKHGCLFAFWRHRRLNPACLPRLKAKPALATEFAVLIEELHCDTCSLRATVEHPHGSEVLPTRVRHRSPERRRP